MDQPSTISTGPAISFPLPVFFYGSLMDLDVLRLILKLAEPPKLQSARILGWKIRIWGQFPALVSAASSTDAGRDSVVKGKLFYLQDVAQLQKLVSYEGDTYMLERVDIMKDEGDPENVSQGVAFVFNGEADEEELRDGVFDVEGFQRDVKPTSLGWYTRIGEGLSGDE